MPGMAGTMRVASRLRREQSQAFEQLGPLESLGSLTTDLYIDAVTYAFLRFYDESLGSLTTDLESLGSLTTDHKHIL